MNLHLLKIFYTVALEKNFSNAAKKLFISQPAVSKSVQTLEDQLGLPLINRQKRLKKEEKGVQLTEDGKALFEHARAIFSLERITVDEMQARLQIKKGKLSIGASTTLAGYWLPAYLSIFLQQYPKIELCVKVGNTQTITQKLIDGEIDFALVEGLVKDTRIQIDVWRHETLEIVAASFSTLNLAKEINVDQLNQLTWLIREAGSGTHDVTLEMLKTLDIQPHQFIELGSNEMIARSVSAGLGVSILPKKVIHELKILDQLKTITMKQSHLLTRPLYIFSLKNRPLSPLMQAFHDLLHTHETIN
ncbi:LysR substrate-binding domain-containing protein [Neisseria sp. Ec49-e6-T10]|uniref:LysR substrate-binding domain-containing protein n=1 Tax=Neisseria sp. Ec49-e6-T10 TaxID=3140744 RepID=UPI003EB864A5